MKIVFIFICFLALTVQSEAQYEYLKLAFQWKPTVCILKTCDGGKVANFEPDFYIHGLWPANYSVNQPDTCTEDKYNRSDPVTVGLKNNGLRDYWPNMLSADDDKFWKIEFEKHGTCMIGPNFQQGDYFYAALGLSYDIWSIEAIEVALQIPAYNTNFSTYKIVRNLRSRYGVFPEVACHRSRTDLLMEVRFCYDNNFQPIGCPYRTSYCDQLEIKLPL